MRIALAPVLYGVLSIAASPALWAQQEPEALLVQDFEDRVKDYVKLHKQVESRMPALKTTVSPEKISHYEHELAERIRAERRGAVQGNIFTPKLADQLRRIIAMALQGTDATLVRQSLQHAEPVRVRVRINENYPANVPLQSTPPTLLMALPPLPAELDYRVVAKDLVLRDVKANLVVDVIPNAIP